MKKILVNKFVVVFFLITALCVTVGCHKTDDDDCVPNLDDNTTITPTTTDSQTSSNTKVYFCDYIYTIDGQPTISNDTTVTLAEGYEAYVDIHSFFYFHYYWNSKIPNTFTEDFYNKFSSPEEMAESFIVSEDEWSYVKAYEDNLTENIDNGFKYVYDNTDGNVRLYVSYVYDKSPYKVVGLRRGCVITKINGKKLTSNNYKSLLNKVDKTITFVETIKDSDGNIQLGSEETTTPEITSRTININSTLYWEPIPLRKKIETPSANIGYVLFNSWSDSATVAETFQDLKTMNVDEVVLDMRCYSGGWYDGITLASCLLPANKQGKTFLKYKYSNRHKNKRDEEIKLTKSMFNLGLSRVYILTSKFNTGIAPLVQGLLPHTNVIIIGDNCEYNGDYVFTESHNLYKEISCTVVEAKCVDADDDPIMPYLADYKVEDTFYYELGDPAEPLLAKALELINE